MQSPSYRSISSFFLRGSLTRALFRWLTFEQFVRSARKLSITDASSEPEQQVDWLRIWEAQVTLERPLRTGPLLWSLVSAFFGLATMVGVLSASHAYGVNIWAMLLVFVAMPLLLVMISLVWLFRPIRGLSGHPLMAMMVKKIAVQPLGSSTRLMVPWLQWQFQRGGIAFMVSALITFFVFATFQDVRFVWSSTFIENSTTMHRLLSAIAWPWHWWMAVPDLSVVEASRFRTGVTLAEPNTDNSLWPFVVTCMVVYGLLPRLLLSGVYRVRLRLLLRRELKHSSLPEQFFTIQQHAVSRAALIDQPDDDVLRLLARDAQTHRLLGWRQPSSESSLEKNLGIGRWSDDEQWLQQAQFGPSRPVLLLIDFWQTPVGELSDCIAIVQSAGAQVTLMLTGYDDRQPRADAQVRSWHYFAQKNQVSLVQEATS